MRLFKNFLKPARLFGLAILFGLILVRITDPVLVKTLRLSSFDYYQVMKPREFIKQPIAIVDLDEASLREYGQWPWPRTRVADLIDGIAGFGGVATAFDIVFSEPDRLSPSQIAKDNTGLSLEIRQSLEALPDNEAVMASAMAGHPVVLGQASVRNPGDASPVPRDIKPVGVVTIGEDPLPFLERTKHYDLVQNIEILEEAATGYGIFSLHLERDDVVRRVPLVALVRDKIRFALSAELLRVSTGGESFAIKTNEAGLEGIKIAGSFIGTDAYGNVWPYFSSSSQLRYISAGSILNGTVNPDMINGHMVLVGTSVAGLEDFRATPLGVPMPGVEIHAQIIENIMTGQFLKRPAVSLLIEVLITLFAGLLVISFVPRLRGIRSSIGVAMLVSGLFAYSWWRFASDHVLLDATYPALVTILLFVLMITASYIREERQRKRIRGAFGQYLSPALVDQLTEHPEKLILGGETRQLSILFSDIRGFTTISEDFRQDPAGLTRLMNSILTRLSQPILKYNGTIDKYLGDAVMAFWNAPIDEEDHAYLACRAALKMIDNIDVFNEKNDRLDARNTQRKSHRINIGIGINTGDCIVGNMGSETRFDYTALGDAVNIASRLEGQSKPYGVPIVIGEQTANLVRDRLAIYEVDLIRVIGKSEPIHIYALAGTEDMSKLDDFIAFKALNASLLSSYRLQDWQSALEAIGLIDTLNQKLGLPLDDYLFIYQTRIEEFKVNSPGKHWDGVYSAITK